MLKDKEVFEAFKVGQDQVIERLRVQLRAYFGDAWGPSSESLAKLRVPSPDGLGWNPLGGMGIFEHGSGGALGVRLPDERQAQATVRAASLAGYRCTRRDGSEAVWIEGVKRSDQAGSAQKWAEKAKGELRELRRKLRRESLVGSGLDKSLAQSEALVDELTQKIKANSFNAVSRSRRQGARPPRH